MAPTRPRQENMAAGSVQDSHLVETPQASGRHCTPSTGPDTSKATAATRANPPRATRRELPTVHANPGTRHNPAACQHGMRRCHAASRSPATHAFTHTRTHATVTTFIHRIVRRRSEAADPRQDSAQCKMLHSKQARGRSRVRHGASGYQHPVHAP